MSAGRCPTCGMTTEHSSPASNEGSGVCLLFHVKRQTGQTHLVWSPAVLSGLTHTPYKNIYKSHGFHVCLWGTTPPDTFSSHHNDPRRQIIDEVQWSSPWVYPELEMHWEVDVFCIIWRMMIMSWIHWEVGVFSITWRKFHSWMQTSRPHTCPFTRDQATHKAMHVSQ